MEESFWWKSTGYDDRLCPVLFSLPGGFLNVMPRAVPAAEPIDYDYFNGLPLDTNDGNFGWVRGRLVLVDYGS